MSNINLNQVIDLTQDDIEKCKDFATKVVGETYDRFNQSLEIRSKRIFFGKLGEVIFLKFLNNNKIFPSTEGMFEIYEGQTNVDAMDFETTNGKKIDIKTAYEQFHSRLLVPYDQFENGKAKDYFIGVKIKLSEKKGEIYGFCTKEHLEKRGKKNFGEGDAYWEFLNNLNDLEKLLPLMRRNLNHFFNS
jgi:hypothetical protein